MGETVVGLYVAVLLLLALLALHRQFLTLKALGHRPRLGPAERRAGEEPIVTVQIPVFNERYVIGHALEAVRALQYPRDRLEIQVLDDSTDDTPEMVAPLAAAMRREGLAAYHLRRESRAGYKAGALAEGLQQARGELIAILDADFRPYPDFLERILPHFRDPTVGLVQARWGYLNRDHSLLTRLQALRLDAHFLVEHLGRHRAGAYFNFNGTAGVWRRACLEASGGWASDTLTEDLDISYRAQMQGWRFAFAPEVVVPSELPVEMAAFRSQHHRWTKGSVQTARKLLPGLLTGSYPARVKREGLFHLAGAVGYPLLAAFSLALVPVVAIRSTWDGPLLPWLEGGILLLGLATAGAFFGAARRVAGLGGLAWLRDLPALMAFEAALGWSGTRAVLEGLWGRDEPFRRTPKHGAEAGTGWLSHRYGGRASSGLMVEGALSGYFLLGCQMALAGGLYGALALLGMFAFGHAYIPFTALRQWLLRRREQARHAVEG